MPGTVGELIAASAAAHPDTVAVALDDEQLTYAELHERSGRLASGLLGAGVGKGTRVGILCGNGPDWVVWWAAILRIGAIAVPLSTFAPPPELARVIRHADLHAVVFQRAFLGRDLGAVLQAAVDGIASSRPPLACTAAPFLRSAIAMTGPAPAWATEVSGLDDGAVSAAVRAAAEAEVHAEDVAITIYTSGQSADPKGVPHVHRTVTSKALYLAERLGIASGLEVACTMPFFWVGGLVMALLPSLAVGATVRCQDASSFGLPVIGAGRDVGNPFPEGMPIPALGMTETFGIYSWGRTWRAPGSELAPPLDELEPGYETKVVDGELLVRGPTVTRVLVKRDRDADFDDAGFYRTGDGARELDGQLHFTGRVIDMIKTSGANVSPAEVERELSAIEGVANAFVVALDHPSRGQEVVGALVPEPGAILDVVEIRKHLRTRLSAFKVPRRLAVLDPTEVPLTPSQKVRKRQLAALIAERVPEDNP